MTLPKIRLSPSLYSAVAFGIAFLALGLSICSIMVAQHAASEVSQLSKKHDEKVESLTTMHNQQIESLVNLHHLTTTAVGEVYDNQEFLARRLAELEEPN